MQSMRASVSLRPKLYQWVKEQAESRQMSISRYIERCVEEKRGDDDDELAYPIEDVLREAREAKEEMKAGKLKMYDTAEEMFEALGI
ncbi:MAG: hypothetical protein IJ793_03410 [Opitutales bacterium]|jgi:predicted DNA-binding ribbon-helix-helix protein|nr:hypothetical protein [Opitutales bacterium]